MEHINQLYKRLAAILDADPTPDEAANVSAWLIRLNFARFCIDRGETGGEKIVEVLTYEMSGEGLKQAQQRELEAMYTRAELDARIEAF